MENKDVRIKILVNGAKNYQIAEVLGITEFTFSRWLRKELSLERREKVLLAIKKLTKEGKADDSG